MFLKFWLTIPFRFVAQWDNSTPKAEALPGHFCYITKWVKKNAECQDKDHVKKHRLLYQKLVEKLCHNDIYTMQIDWIKAQIKGLENRLKDFNWLVLHNKLPVRSNLYRHKLSRHEHCPRPDCSAEETICHVLWECPFARSVWEKLKGKFVSMFR